MAINSERPQIQVDEGAPGPGSIAVQTRPGAEASPKLTPEPDLLKKFVRMVFERELRRMQALAGDTQACEEWDRSESLELPMRTFLGKHFPENGSGFRWQLARVTRRSHLLALRIHSLRTLYGLLFEQALVEEDLSPEEALRLDANELRRRLNASFCRNLEGLCGSSRAGGKTLDQLENALAWFDRQIKTCLEWCVSLLPYHAPALAEQDPQVILVRSKR